MTLNLITLATVKKFLGLTASTYDSALTALIPAVSADVRRILNNQYNTIESASFDSSSKNINMGAGSAAFVDHERVRYQNMIEIGTVVTHPNIPADTYIESYDYATGLYTLSATPTGSGDYINPTINVSMFDAISKMIWYKYKKQNTSSAMAKEVSSESFGGVSQTYTDREINKRWNYPQALIDDLGIPYARIG